MARTVLVADDSPTIQKRASGILTGEGLEVVTVSNGVAAIKKLPQVKPLVILADVSMPGKDGYEVCEFVKNSPDLHHVPVVLIVSDMEPYDEERGARVRADGKIQKRATGTPFDAEELISTVMKFLAQSEASAAQAATARTVSTAAPPEAAVVTEPVDEEPEVAPRETVDISSLSEAVAFAEPALEAAPEPAPEPAPAPEPMAEAEISTEPTPPVEVAPAGPEEAPAAAALTTEESPVPAEPMLIEEPVALLPEALPAPSPESTLMFHTPAEIAQPVLSDELAPTPPFAGQPEAPAVPAATLDSFSLAEAAAGRVRFAVPEAAVVPDAQPPASSPEPAVEATVPAAPPAPVDAGLVYSIVQRAVLRMSPPALSPYVIEELATRLADEITAELNAESSRIQ